MVELELQNAVVLSPWGAAPMASVFIDAGRIAALQETRSQSRIHAHRTIDLEGAFLAPGFIDVQVNGGGGVLLNDNPSEEGMRHVASVHRQFGTTKLLPTIISDGPEVARRAVEAARRVSVDPSSGIPGLH
ncbi:MAG: hypothetical protein V2I43_02620, partial [Parvularcula sp.]|nr:hypothetical protein [Parvularcula sp.]